MKQNRMFFWVVLVGTCIFALLIGRCQDSPDVDLLKKAERIWTEVPNQEIVFDKECFYKASEDGDQVYVYYKFVPNIISKYRLREIMWMNSKGQTRHIISEHMSEEDGDLWQGRLERVLSKQQE